MSRPCMSQGTLAFESVRHGDPEGWGMKKCWQWLLCLSSLIIMQRRISDSLLRSLCCAMLGDGGFIVS